MPTLSLPPPPRVLVVDDDPSVRSALAELLPACDIEVAATVDRGEAAVPTIAEALQQGTRIDVVIMDVRMPGIGGLEATRQVRAAFPYVQVLLHTAFSGHLAEQPRKVDVFAEIPKGIQPRKLIDLIWTAHQAAQAAWSSQTTAAS